MNILQTKQLTKSYGTGDAKVTALNRLNLKIDRGEFVSIVGPSGSGKSTLLHMLGGVDRPTSGSVYIHQDCVTDMNETQLAVFRRRHVGLIYQSFHLIPTLNVRKNILLPVLLDNKKPNDRDFGGLVDMLGLSDRLEHLPSQLSGGQKQRVAIGRALICRPAIILADEPTGNLDSENGRAILSLLKEANRAYNQTIVMITHDEKIAAASERKITMMDGEIVSDEVTSA